MRLLSVNVALPREVPYRGKTLRTGIYKEPVAGRVMLHPFSPSSGWRDAFAHLLADTAG